MTKDGYSGRRKKEIKKKEGTKEDKQRHLRRKKSRYRTARGW